MTATTEPAPAPGARRSPWVIAIIVALVVVAVVNVLFLYIAIRGQDPVVDSYITEPR